MKQLLHREGNHPDAQAVLSKVIQQLQQTQPKVEAKEENMEIEVEQEVREIDEQVCVIKVEESSKPPSDWLKLNQFLTKICEVGKCINWKQAELALKTFCLKPAFRHQVYDFLLEANPSETILYLLRQKTPTKLPPPTTARLLTLYLEGVTDNIASDSGEAFRKYLGSQIDRWVEPADLRDNVELLKAVLQFNSQEGRYGSTTRITRSLAIAYKKEPEFLEFCNHLANAQ